VTVTHERRDSVAREDLMRSAPFSVVRAADTEPGDGLTLDGYAAVFGSETVIDSWEGRFKETLLPGSFRKTLRERTPRLQFDHGMHPLIGSIPIGKIVSAAEDAQGVHVVARLSDNWLIQPVRDAIEEGAIDGMSFRWNVVREEWRYPDGKPAKFEDVLNLLWSSYDLPEDELLTRHVKELKCSELGPVVWPAYDDTSVGVRAKVTIDLGSLDTDPAQRRTLAQALYVADAVERGETQDSGEITADAPPPAGHPSQRDESPAAPPDAPPPDGHPSPTPSPGQLQREREIALLRARSDIALKGATRHVG